MISRNLENFTLKAEIFYVYYIHYTHTLFGFSLAQKKVEACFRDIPKLPVRHRHFPETHARALKYRSCDPNPYEDQWESGSFTEIVLGDRV